VRDAVTAVRLPDQGVYDEDGVPVPAGGAGHGRGGVTT
jgi:hypothetical protein